MNNLSQFARTQAEKIVARRIETSRPSSSDGRLALVSPRGKVIRRFHSGAVALRVQRTGHPQARIVPLDAA